MSDWKSLDVEELKDLFREKNAEQRDMVKKRDKIEEDIITLDEEITKLWLEIDKRLRVGGFPRGEA